jgi:hypothetical protein
MRDKFVLFAVFVLLASAGGAIASDNSIQIGGTTYFDYFIDTTDWPDGYCDQAVQGFRFTRSYVTLKKSWDELEFRVTTDIDDKYGTGNLNVYTKYAYLQWKGLVPDAAVLIGQHSPMTHGWVEKRWHYRSIAKTIGDENKWTHSAEVGIGLQGKAAAEKLEYYIDVNNGNGYKDAVAKDGIGVAGRLAYVPVKGASLSGLVTSNTPGGNDDEAEIYAEGVAGYDTDRFGLFAQYGVFTDGNRDDRESAGLSVFGRARVQEGVYALARLDLVDPDTDVDDDAHSLVIAGVDYEVRGGLYLQPTFRLKTYEAENRMDGAIKLPDSESEFVLTILVEY